MNYTPECLCGISIKKSLLEGYNKKQVDGILAKVAEDYRAYNKEICELKCKIRTLDETVQHYKTLEETLQHSILVAQHTGEQIKANACEKAGNIIQEAELKAQKLIESANNEVNKIKVKYEQLKSELFTFKSKSEALLHAQIDVLKQFLTE